ncbi:MAG TPA: VCBS repeat-containing protein [Vicinamibacterales bacterium]|nr:VCBS repeat-containing protein [Vicinamibacterales bacterium]
MTHLLFAVCVALTTSRQLPPALAASLPDWPAPLTSIVVADIDRDGDADVVATDEALHLFVWINDGTGRLVRQDPAPSRGAPGDAARPGVEGDGPAAQPSVPIDPPTFDAQPTSSIAVVLAWSGFARGAEAARPERPRASQRLRGPPCGSPLL